MITFKPVLVCCAAGWLFAASAAGAQSPADHAAHHGDDAAGSAESELASGEVRRIDKAQKRITLRHGEIKTLDMPPMSMIFRVRQDDLLDAVKVGDKVLFTAIKDTDGTYVVTSIKPAP
ncbi:MAG: copper-binding protein [Burkholderiaceae bacterium]|jgi:Cu/Ag efflux protein CusF|nr:copper-binding protein [Burkholderiaceae bacterium]